ncbi:glycosyltransferase family 4 protein [Terrilactibacillus laevilacticus]|uniref:glycosyltransferase family 4 protein n=1 Tax=Terrilactibacillus laevilacticus TaxID=1380157 RepID=UPI001146F08D|nr:glycosyltransferase family 4 protein [Terrilactibacillus laevilacticus]
MKVNVSVGGLWHAPSIVTALYKTNNLGNFYTSRPYFKLPQTIRDIDRKSVTTYGWIELVERISTMGLKRSMQYEKALIFDNVVSKNLSDCDIFVCWSSFGLKSIKKAKQNGAITVVERGSTHIKTQDRILKEAFEKNKLDYTEKNGAILPQIIEREQQEYELADYISVPSSFVYKSFLENGIDKSKLLLTPYGVKLNKYNIDRSYDKEEINILFVGNVGFRKGIPVLLKAFEEVSKLISIKLVLVGKVDLNLSKKLTTYKNIVVKGILDKKELDEVYKSSDIFILPSVEEGMARVILEAMSFGLCPICSYNSGALDIIEEGVNGYLFEPYDDETLIKKILELYYDREKLKVISLNAKKRIECFSDINYEKIILNKYKNILRKQPNLRLG